VCLWCEITEGNERMTLVFPLDSYVVFNDFISHMVFYLLVFRLSRVYCLTLTCALDFITLVIFGEDYKLLSVLLCSAVSVCLTVCVCHVLCSDEDLSSVKAGDQVPQILA